MVRVQPDTPTGDAPTRAAARAAQQRRRLQVLLGVIIVLALALAAVVGIVLTRGSGDGGTGGRPAAGACLPAPLRVTADPAVAAAVESVVADLAAGRDDCPEVTVQAEESAATVAALAEGAAPAFDVWVPESSMWPARAQRQAEVTGATTAELVVHDPVATTPVVFAATESTAEALEGAGFASLAGGAVAAALPDPVAVGSSAAALLALQTALGGDARTFTGVVLGLDTGVVPTAADALDAAAAASEPTIAVTTEQAVELFNDGAGERLVALHPTDVQPVVSIPLVTLADADEETLAAAEKLSTALAGDGDALAAHGLRDAAGHGAASGDADTAAEPTDGVNQAEALRTWEVLTAPSRMLSLNDVSGSMLQPATAEMRRIDLFEQAAVGAINAMSDESSLATWVFSSRRIGAQDWQEIVPFGRLGDPVHKQRMIETALSLDSLVGGGTGLYDSVLAAVQYMRETYVPGEVNLVLLNTDGFNEDDEGLDLETLLVELEKLRDPANPVAVIAIGYGPDTDQAALERIAAATDGAAYQALRPTDIGTVLIDAITQRGCRPFCA